MVHFARAKPPVQQPFSLTEKNAAFIIKKSIQKGKRGQKRMARRMNRRKKAGRHLRIGRVIVALGLLACSLFFLGRYIVQAIQIQQINRQNQALLMQTSAPTASPTPAPTADAAAARAATKAPTIAPATPIAARAATPSPSPTQAPRVLARYQKLVEKNSDTVGWLKVNCIAEINFAVVQRDNSFYMTRDFNGQMNMNGAPFLDEYCSISPRDDNLLIYGHNMKNGQMFGKLRQMNSWEKLSANPFVTFDTIYETGTYVPIAMFPCSIIPYGEDVQRPAGEQESGSNSGTAGSGGSAGSTDGATGDTGATGNGGTAGGDTGSSGGTTTTPTEPETPAQPETPACPPNRRTIVQEGQTAGDLQLRYGLSYHTLQDANSQVDLETIKGGDVVCIPEANVPCPLPLCVTLGENDTLESVAVTYNLPIAALLRANPCLAPEDFTAGTQIRLPN